MTAQVDRHGLIPYIPSAWDGGASRHTSNVGEAMCTEVQSHLRWCERRGLRPNTIYARKNTLARVGRYAGRCACNLDRTTVDRWWADHPATPAARAVDLSHLRSFYRWGIEAGVVSEDPTSHLPVPRRKRGLPRPVSEDEMARAIDHAPPRVREALVLAAYAGLRGCEIATLRGEDLLWDQGLLLVHDGKGGRQRVVPMHPEVKRTLSPLARTRGALLRKVNGQPITTKALQKQVSLYLNAIGCDSTLHAFRHRFGSRLYAETTDLRLVQEMLGHASPATTAVYTAWSPDRARAGIGAL